MKSYKAFLVELKDAVAHVQINRPEKRNAMAAEFWQEIGEIFAWVDATPQVRVVVLSGVGPHFCSGIDLHYFASVASKLTKDVGRNALVLRQQIKQLQNGLSAIDTCSKPVIAAVQGYCIGGAIDLISACDMRYASADAMFSIKEVDLGMAADVGTLQRLPHIIGDGVLRELAYTGRLFAAQEAERIGLLNCSYADQQSMLDEVFALAAQIAEKSPLAVQGTKEMLRYARDHSVEDGLNYIATWNAAMLQSEDVRIALAAQMKKAQPEFSD